MATSNEPMPSDPHRSELVPVVWLLGKVQSGKTSITRALTRSSDAAIGSGFKACTRTARVFDFPAEKPVMRFLDTRGLGETDYDPSEDMRFCEGRAHLVLGVAKAMDADVEALLAALTAIRRRHPDWPVVIAQTALHEGYPAGRGHTLPYPFANDDDAGAIAPALRQALVYQRSRFHTLPGGPVAFVPLDFTRDDDGLPPAEYGQEALVDALIAAAPTALSVALAQLPAAGEGAAGEADRAHILRFALAAGASDVIPAAGAVGVPIVQSALLVHLARRHGAEWTGRMLAEFAAAMGVGTLLRVGAGFGVRQLVKLIPGYGQTVGAAAAATASFATTYALGRAAAFFLAKGERGRRAAEVAEVYRSSLAEAFHLAKERGPAGTAAAPAASTAP